MKRYLILAACTALVTLGACAGDSKFPEATGEGSVRAINTISTSPAFSFLVEERVVGNVEYRTASITSQYDDLEYTFNFEVALAGDSTRTRVASEFVDVVADKDYTFVISGAIAAPAITLWEGDVRDWSGDETVFEARLAHTAASLDNIDVYLAPAMDPPTPPVAGAAIGTLAFGEILPAADFDEGAYILTVTEAGDETTVLFQSDPFTPAARTSVIVSVFDADANELAPVSVTLINATSGGNSRLVDSTFSPTARFYHASIDLGNVDIYIEDPLGTPVVSDQVFRGVSGDIEVPAGDLPLTYTTAGNMGMVLIDQERIISPGSQTSYYLIKSAAGEDAIVTSNPDRRPIETFARLNIINTSTNHTAVDIYFVQIVPPDPDNPPPDDPIADVQPLIANLPLGGSPAALPLFEGSYDLYVTVSGTKDVLAGPERLDLLAGDIEEAIIYDNADPAIADLVVIPSP